MDPAKMGAWVYAGAAINIEERERLEQEYVKKAIALKEQMDTDLAAHKEKVKKECDERMLKELRAAKSELEVEYKKKQVEADAKLEIAFEECYREVAKMKEEMVLQQPDIKLYKEKLEREYNDKLADAYIVLQDEFDKRKKQIEQLGAEYEEHVKQERAELGDYEKKLSDLEVRLYEEFEKKLKEAKEFIVDKVDQFLDIETQKLKDRGQTELVERLTYWRQQKPAAQAVEEAINGGPPPKESVDQLKSQIRRLEARNMRMSVENARLTEALRKTQELITAPVNDRRQRRVKAQEEAQEKALTHAMEQWKTLAGVNKVNAAALKEAKGKWPGDETDEQVKEAMEDI